MGDLTTLSLNLYADIELPETSKTAAEKLIVSAINNGLKYAVVSITDITRVRKR